MFLILLSSFSFFENLVFFPQTLLKWLEKYIFPLNDVATYLSTDCTFRTRNKLLEGFFVETNFSKVVFFLLRMFFLRYN